jgi:intracellular sulfur oxidation DsrE/DsrF family protein
MIVRRLLLAAALVLGGVPASATDKVHRLALQISDNSTEKMETVLGNTVHVAAYYASKGEKVEIRIVAFHGGLNMLRTDRSPVLPQLKAVAESLPNVGFDACNNTREEMARAEGKKPDAIPLFAAAKIVPSGVVDLIELHEVGWTIVRP